MAKIVIIYDRILRSDTTGVYCEAALRQTRHEVIYYPPLVKEGEKLFFKRYSDLPRGADLYFQVDDDMSYPGPDVPSIRAYWCIDTHRMDYLVGGMTRWEKLKAFDYVFAAQKDAAEKLRCPWLPLAFDPAAWRCLPGTKKKFDWCFVANMNTPSRRDLVARLTSLFPCCFTGQAYGDEINAIYNQSRLVLNLTVGNDINMRFFEAQATGTPLITNRPENGEDLLFDDVIYYQNQGDLEAKMADLLKLSPQDLESIGNRQRERVLADHTYSHRMEQMLGTWQLD